VICVALLFATAAGASQGDPDPRFGTGGFVTTSLKRSCDSFAVQSDGKMLVLSGVELRRFDARGAPDASFGIAGRVVLQDERRSADLVVASGGKIYLVSRLMSSLALENKYPVLFIDAYDLTGTPIGSFSEVVPLTDLSSGPLTRRRPRATRPWWRFTWTATRPRHPAS